MLAPVYTLATLVMVAGYYNVTDFQPPGPPGVDGAIYIGAYSAFRNALGPFPQFAIPMMVKTALLAWKDGAVLEPPAARSTEDIQVLFWDECRSFGAACTATANLDLAMNVLLGNRLAGQSFAPVRALIGGVVYTPRVAYVAEGRQVPQMGFYATADVLSDKSQYPFYSRVVAAKSLAMKTVEIVLGELRFTRATLWVCNDTTGVSVRDSYLQTLKLSLKPILVARTIGPQTLANGTEGCPPVSGSLQEALFEGLVSAAQSFRARVHISEMLASCGMYDVMHYVASRGLVSYGYFWISPQDMLMTSLYVTYATALPMLACPYGSNSAGGALRSGSAYLSPLASRAFDGMVFVLSQAQGGRMQEWWTWFQSLAGSKDQLFEPWLASQIPPSAFASLKGPFWMLQTILPAIFDATWAVLRSVNSLLLKVGNNFTSEQLKNSMRNDAFVGLTGNVSFYANGDRAVAFDILQFQLTAGASLDDEVAPVPVGFLGKLGEVRDGLPKVPRWSFYNRSQQAPPAEDLACAPGSHFDAFWGACRACLPGTVAPSAGLSECVACAAGTYAPGASQSSCLPCRPGTYSEPGALECVSCQPGSFSNDIQQTTCPSCPPGTYSSGVAATQCTRCRKGFYQPLGGQADCLPCSGKVTRDTGSSSAEECVCARGSYLPVGGGPCVACTKEWLCPEGSSEADLRAVALGQKSPEGACAEEAACFPQVRPGYMSRRADPLVLFRCAASADCPGGPPGLCAPGRDAEMIACGECLPSHYVDSGQCSPCTEGGVTALPIVLAILAALAVVAGVMAAVCRDVLSQSLATTTAVTMSGLMFTSAQSLQVFAHLTVPWMEPLKTIFSAFKLLSFDFRLLKLGCLVQTGPLALHLARQLVAPAGLVLVGFAVCLQWRCGRDRSYLRRQFFNTAGSVLSIFFISVTISALTPLVCYRHPGGHSESMESDPAVLCFQSAVHSAMLGISGGAAMLVIIPFAAVVVYGSWAYPHFVRESTTRSSDSKLQLFRFLYFRFRPEAYFYGVPAMLRSLLVCLVPVVVRNDASIQVIVMCAILQSFLIGQMVVMPWRTPSANFADVCMTSLLVLFMICGALSVENAAATHALAVMGTFLFALCCLCVLVCAGYVIGRYAFPGTPFAYFVCHHKADAAAQSRYLQLRLQEKGQQRVFIDSDHLQDLDTLFDTVRCRVKHLIVFLTRDTLRRPWCAGEITTAFRNKLPVTLVVTSTFKPPTSEELSDLSSYIDFQGVDLAAYNIQSQDIKDAYTWFLSPERQVIHPCKSAVSRKRIDEVVGQVLSKTTQDDKEQPVGQAAPLPVTRDSVVISADPLDDETSAAAGVIASKLAPQILDFVKGGIVFLADFPELISQEDIAASVWDARTVVVLLSRNTLSSAQQLRTIAAAVLAAEQGASQFIPVALPDFRFPSESYYDSVLPDVLPLEFDAVSPSLEAFFRRIAVPFSSAASDAVISAQVTDILGRVPRVPPGGVESSLSMVAALSMAAARSSGLARPGRGSRPPRRPEEAPEEGPFAEPLSGQCKEGPPAQPLFVDEDDVGVQEEGPFTRPLRLQTARGGTR